MSFIDNEPKLEFVVAVDKFNAACACMKSRWPDFKTETENYGDMIMEAFEGDFLVCVEEIPNE